jgi:hypothetical protein
MKGRNGAKPDVQWLFIHSALGKFVRDSRNERYYAADDLTFRLECLNSLLPVFTREK